MLPTDGSSQEGEVYRSGSVKKQLNGSLRSKIKGKYLFCIN